MNMNAFYFLSFILNLIFSVDLIALLILEKCNVWRVYSTLGTIKEMYTQYFTQRHLCLLTKYHRA